jgi:hypothetical protein
MAKNILDLVLVRFFMSTSVRCSVRLLICHFVDDDHHRLDTYSSSRDLFQGHPAFMPFYSIFRKLNKLFTGYPRVTVISTRTPDQELVHLERKTYVIKSCSRAGVDVDLRKVS